MKKNTTGNAKLPTVALGMEMQENIKELEKQIGKLKEKNANLEHELIAARKVQSGTLLKEDLQGNESFAEVKEENAKMKVDNYYLGRAGSDEGYDRWKIKRKCAGAEPEEDAPDEERPSKRPKSAIG